MTRGKLSAKQVNEKKWLRLKLVLQNLRKKGPLTSSEICQLLFGPSMNKTDLRSAQNYLAELVALDLVSYEITRGVYELADSKRVFQSKADYNLAFAHSKHIVLTDMGNQGLEDIDDDFILDRLAFLEEDLKEQDKEGWGKAEIDFDREYLLQHLKTGYPEIHLLIQRYKQIRVKHRIHSSMHTLGDLKPEKPFEEKDWKELENLRDLFAGKISRLVREVKDGIPLSGFCDGCPGTKVTIKDK
jgi:hypothetical protein